VSTASRCQAVSFLLFLRFFLLLLRTKTFFRSYHRKLPFICPAPGYQLTFFGGRVLAWRLPAHQAPEGRRSLLPCSFFGIISEAAKKNSLGNLHLSALSTRKRRCSRTRPPLGNPERADTFKRVAETWPRLANAVGEGRLSLTDFLPEVEK
jgi:hypothetical protein